MYFSGLFVRRQTISFSHTLLCLRKGNFALELKNRLKMSNLCWMKIENWIKEIFFDLFFINVKIILFIAILETNGFSRPK